MNRLRISQSPSQLYLMLVVLPSWAIPQIQVKHESCLVGALQSQLAQAPLQSLAALRWQVLLPHAPLEALAALRC